MNRDVLEVVDAAIALPIRVLLVQRGIFFLSRADTDDDIIVPSQIFFGMYCVKCDISAKVLSILSIASLFPRRRLWLVVMSLPPLPQDVEQRDWACYEIIIACRVQMQNKFYHRERSCLIELFFVDVSSCRTMASAAVVLLHFYFVTSM